MPRFEDEYENEEQDSSVASFNATPASATYPNDFPALQPTTTTTPLRALSAAMEAINARLPNVTVYRQDTTAVQQARDELDENVLDGAWGVANKTTDASLATSLAVESTVANVRRVLPPQIVHEELANLLHSSVGAAKEAMEKLLHDAIASLQEGYQGSARNNTAVFNYAREEYHRDPDSAWMPSPDLPWAVAITAVTTAGLLALVASRWIYARRTASSATLAVSRPNRVTNIVARILSDGPATSPSEQVTIEMSQAEPQDLSIHRFTTPSGSQPTVTSQPTPPPPSVASSSASAGLSERSRQTTAL
jgi:hypothetical protein